MTDVQVQTRKPTGGRVYWDRTSSAIAVVLGATTIGTLAALSHLNHGMFTLLGSSFLPYVLGFLWLILMAFAVADRRVRAPLIFAPLVITVLALAPYTNFPSHVRLDLSRNSMDAYARTLPAPTPPLDRELSDTELENYDTTFPEACPWVLGSYRIVECRTIPSGYAFLTSVDDGGEGAGLAYMPGGPPQYSLSPDILQKPIFEPLGDSWYRLIMSW